MLACGPARCSPHAHMRRHDGISYPRPVPRLLQREGVLRFDTSVGSGRATTFSARWNWRGSRDSSNPAPKALDPGLAGTRSQLLCGLPGASMRLESATSAVSSTAHLPGFAAAAISTGIGLGVAHQSSPREVRAERPHTRHARSHARAAASPPLQLPPRCSRHAPVSPSAHSPVGAAFAQAAAPWRCGDGAPTSPSSEARPGRRGPLRSLPAAARACGWLARAPPRAVEWAASVQGAERRPQLAGRRRNRLSAFATALRGACRWRREIGAIRSVWRLRGGSGRVRAGQAVVPGHSGASRCVGDPT